MPFNERVPITSLAELVAYLRSEGKKTALAIKGPIEGTHALVITTPEEGATKVESKILGGPPLVIDASFFAADSGWQIWKI